MALGELVDVPREESSLGALAGTRSVAGVAVRVACVLHWGSWRIEVVRWMSYCSNVRYLSNKDDHHCRGHNSPGASGDRARRRPECPERPRAASDRRRA